MKIKIQDIKTRSLNFIKLLNDKISKSNLEHFQTVSFNSNEFRNKKTLNNALKRVEKNKYPLIYIISIPNKKSKNKIITSFEKFKKANDLKIKNVNKVNLSRYNSQYINSDTIYVGSSTTNFITRIKNHLGVLGIRVYSLHLSKWDENLNYEISIEIYEVRTENEDEILERFVVEVIEQQIWQLLKPVFGKKSGL
jgi:hypothetical protein